MIGLDIFVALIRQIDVLGPKLAAIWPIGGEVDSHGQIVFIRFQLLVQRIVICLQEETLDRLTRRIVYGVEGYAHICVAPAQQVVGVDQDTVPNPLQDTIANGNVNRADGVCLHLDAGKRFKVVRIQIHRVEYGPAGRILSQLHAAGTDAQGTLIDGIGIQHLSRELVAVGISCCAVGGGIDEQI